MSWASVYGALGVVFAIHLVAFAVAWGRTRKARYGLLCGTFACLTTMNAMLFAGFDPTIGPVRVAWVLRGGALSFTAAWLWTWWRARRASRS